MPQATKASDSLQQHQSLQNVPVDAILGYLSKALVAASAVADRAQALDHQAGGVTSKLYGSLEGALNRTFGAILKAREQASGIQLAVASSGGNAMSAVRSQASTISDAVAEQVRSNPHRPRYR